MIITKMPQRDYDEGLDLWKIGKLDSSGRSDVPLTLDSGTLYGKLANVLSLAMPIFEAGLLEHYSRLPAVAGMRALFSSQPASESPTKTRGRHLDNGKKVLIGLWYFADPDDTAGGDLIVKGMTVPYAPNTMVIFPNTPDAWHEVTPRGPSKHTRRFINFFFETDIPLHNYARNMLGRDQPNAKVLINPYYRIG